ERGGVKAVRARSVPDGTPGGRKATIRAVASSRTTRRLRRWRPYASRQDHPGLHAVPGAQLSHDQEPAQAPRAGRAAQVLPAVQLAHGAQGNEVTRGGRTFVRPPLSRVLADAE